MRQAVRKRITGRQLAIAYKTDITTMFVYLHMQYPNVIDKSLSEGSQQMCNMLEDHIAK